MADSKNSNRIAYIFLEPFFPNHGGYAHAEAIIRALRMRGWQVDLFAPHYRSTGPQTRFFSRLKKLLGCIGRFAIHARQYDLVYVRYHPLSFPPAMVARALGRPVILEINGPWYDVLFNWPVLKFIGGLVRWLFRVQTRLANAIICVTPQLGDLAERIAPGRSVHISNGADTEIFRPNLPRPTNIALPEHYVSFCSFLSLWQGVDTILAAVKEPSWPAGVPIVIAGDGPEIGLIMSATKQFPDRVVYLGVRSQPEIAAIIANARAAIIAVTNLQGRADTGLAPIKLFEAMAAGTPVIATALSFQREIVWASRCGLMVPVEDPKQLALAVSEIVRDGEAAKKMGEAGRKAAVGRYSWEHAADKTSMVIKQLLAKRSLPSH